ncbi:sulfite exporter TauE/SafE family protein [Tropicibacter sp. R15_0]|uniref:sulfite exporter TauE/SafE family protein n=1 Tax=Tropicibacter sp. R15_0 TaxID=2821101 RepID=UPI001AD9FA5C|nr:sulfite exporter TauE/SafE family protein [Tropicibacter sp. R15_0]MBO9466918.1 sulfite exporter TauE/SafE family protein [Tropicibacter sp. R15_0]
MDTIFSNIPLLSLCLGVGLLAGVVKGIVGFAMPMILISGLGSFISPELALAGLIIPTVVTNGMQALRQGGKAAWHTVQQYRLFLVVGGVMILISSQFVRILPVEVMFAVIGVPIVLFCAMQLAGWQPVLQATRRVEVSVAVFAGFMGGMSGVWGPPTVAYLTALGTEKREQMRVQGVIYGLGAVALVVAHIGSGILNAQTAQFSALMVIPAVLGMWVGSRLQDQIDQAAFKRATLVVLLVAGANLLRRALM